MAKLELYYPVRPFHVNQHFGDNLPCVQNYGQSNQMIVTGVDNTTCPIGFDKLYPHFGMAGHNGTDLQAGEQPIYAACAGRVVEKQMVPARGLGLGILTDEAVQLNGLPDHFMKIRYWHLKSFNVEVNQHVEAGDIIGISNNTGFSSGDHLHFEGNPMNVDAGGHATFAYGDGNFNGVVAIAGAIDIEPYFNGKYADEISPSFHHSFVVNLSFGDEGGDIQALQKALQIDGVFPKTQAITGFYGNITRSAVMNFRLKYQISSSTDPLGKSVGPLTRAKLNSLFS